MEGAELRGDFPKDRADWLGRERRAIGRDALEVQVALLQGCCSTPKKRFDIPVIWLVLKDLIQHPFVLPIVHGREDTVRPLIGIISKIRG